jgi:hypothetical protein
MSGLRGNPQRLAELARKLKAIPVRVAQDVAARVAPTITGKAQAAFAAGQTVYGDARPTGVRGNVLDLFETGATASRLKFVAVGTVVRCVLPTRHAKYLIGKYRILPMGRLPVSWSQAIGETTRDEIAKGLAA